MDEPATLTHRPGRTVSARAQRSDPVMVIQFCPARPYLELVVPPGVQTLERLTIVTISHDQGFSGTEDVDRGTYNATFSWFEVVAISPSNHERAPARAVQRNVHASTEKKRHETVLSSAHPDEEVRHWLASVHGGDTIQLIMRAEFPAWVNYCYEAELSLVGKTDAEPLLEQPGGDEASQGDPKGASQLSAFAALATTSESPRYYQPLGQVAREIRVLAIEEGHPDEPLVCTLQTLSLDDEGRESYEALSYCWGNLHTERTIQLLVESRGTRSSEAHQVNITSILYDALCHLRPARPTVGYPSSPRRLWVDFLCINQTDLDERAAQVAIMPKIYSRASTVHIWLGTSSPATKSVFAAIQTIASRYNDTSDLRTASHEQDDIEALHTPILPGEIVSFISDWRRCDFAWFRRSWVLQEVANARSAIVRCGHDTLRWEIILRLSDCVIKAKRKTSLFRHAIMPPIFASLFTLDNSSALAAQATPTRMDILDILIAGHDLDASDARDKIFALLQFGKETADIESLPPLVRPDYSKTEAQVFMDFTRWWIATHRSLRILSAVHTTRDRGWECMSAGGPVDLGALDHPTWSFWHGGIASWAKATLGLAANSPYHATGDSAPDLDLLTSDPAWPASLRLRGHRICTIDSIAPFPIFRAGIDAEMRSAFIRLFDPIGDLRTWIWSREEQTVRQDRFRDVRELLWEHQAAHLPYLQQSGGALPCFSKCYFMARQGGTDGNEQEITGLCPHNAKVGDVVVLLPGGRVPYLLREKTDGQGLPPEAYEFLGECFLEGYMDGKRFEELVARSVESRVFYLV